MQTVLVSGASSGIGKALALDLQNKGYQVIGLSRKIPKDITFPYYSCDLTKSEDIKNTIKEINNRFNHIDVLINCAGVGTGGAVEEVSVEDLKWVYNVNIFGTVELIQETLPLLKKSDHAKIINVGSVAGEITIPYQTSYSMTKSSLSKLSEGLRIELKQFNIGVSTVLPGDTKTDFTSNRKTIINENSDYAPYIKRSIEKMEKDEQNGVSPMKVVKVIEKLIIKKRMPVQVTVGLDYKILVLASRLLPRKLVEFVVTKMYG